MTPSCIQTMSYIDSGKNFASCVTGNNLLKFLKTMDSVSMFSDENFQVSWEETDMVQVEEDDWVSSILGSEDEVINDICNG